MIFGRKVFGNARQKHVFENREINQFKFNPVFDVNQGVANIIGGLDQINKRVAAKGLRVRTDKACRLGDFFEQGEFLLEGTEFLLLREGASGGRPRVFDEACQRRIGQSHAAIIQTSPFVGQKTKPLCIAFIGR